MKVILSIGLNDKAQGVQLVTEDYAKRAILGVLTKYVEGLTIYPTVGVYTHKDGRVTTENGFRVELYQGFSDDIRVACNEIKGILNQESIAVEVVQDNTMFI